MNTTETRRVGNVYYCILCGKPAKEESSGSCHNNDYEEFYTCGCEDAAEIGKLQQVSSDAMHKIFLLKNSMKAKKQLDAIEYQYELQRLKSKFGVTEEIQ